MLLTLLTATASLTLFASAFLAARHAQAAPSGYLLATVIGLLLAVCNAWGEYRIADRLANLTGSWSQSQQDWWGRAFSVVMLLWLPIAAFIGTSLSCAALRLLG